MTVGNAWLIAMSESYADGFLTPVLIHAAQKEKDIYKRIQIIESGKAKELEVEEDAQGLFALYETNEDLEVLRGWLAESKSPLNVKYLHCVYGNPFRPITFDASWLTSTVVSLAKQMYDSKDFSAMPILADALMDAGVENEAILTHCRLGPHAKACWVVDFCLNKS
jgi:aromatic ring-cleaving dioxygenase